MKPKYKSPVIDSILTAITGKSRVDVILAGECMLCPSTDNLPDTFVDDLSRQEYTISGICQACQDKIFGVDPFDISKEY